MWKRLSFFFLLLQFLLCPCRGEQVWDDEWPCEKKRELGILPLPRHVRGAGGPLSLPNRTYSVFVSDKLSCEALDDSLLVLFKEFGCRPVKNNPGLRLFLLTPDAIASPEIKPEGQDGTLLTNRAGDQGYWLKIHSSPAGPIIHCVANTAQGVFYGLQTLRFFHVDPKEPVLPELEILDYPAFRHRVVLEGGYGAWPHEERLLLYPFEGRVKMNGYIYAPKAVPSFRKRWRRLHTEEDLQQFKTEIDEATRYFVSYSYALSPVVRPTYASERTMDILMKKFGALQDMGVTDFGLFFDDVLPALCTPQDIEKYASVGEAQADLANRLLEALEARSPVKSFFFTPSQYAGTTPSDYMAALKEHLRKDIRRGWTGPSICSFEISLEDLKAYEELCGGPVAIGDNHPVNRPLCLGPLRNRDIDLYTHCDSYATNPLTESIETQSVEASRVSVATIADYAWNPLEYDPDWSWKQALLLLGGERAYPWLRVLAEQNQESCCHFSVPSKAKTLAKTFLERGDDPATDALWELKNEFTLYMQARNELKRRLKNELFMDRVQEELQELQDMGSKGVGLVRRITAHDSAAEEELAELVEKMQ